MDTEVTKTIKENESKADKFVRLGESRVNKVMEAIGRIAYLANSGNYEYTQEQVDEMFSIMENRLAEVKSRFAPRQTENHTFSFGKKVE